MLDICLSRAHPYFANEDRRIDSLMNRLVALSTLTLVIAMTGCKNDPETSSQITPQKVPGMSDFDYLACDGGPHLVLSKELNGQWKGAPSMSAVLSPTSDYGRACAATTNQLMALISVGKGQAMVLANPPLSAWGRSPEGWIDIYDLEAWADTNTDAMLKRAIAATPTSGMTNTGKVMTLTQTGMTLLFAGDSPGNTAYGQYSIPIDPGSYRVIEGHYKSGAKEEVYIYRLQPKKD